MIQYESYPPPLLLRSLISLFLAVSVVFGCSKNQIHSTVQFEDISLSQIGLTTEGLGFITPSTVTGREQDIQTLAFIFAQVLETTRPDIKVISLPEILSAINQADIADEYKDMYIDYKNTGIFKKDSLSIVGETTGVRYLAQLRLASFRQQSKGRFSIFGLRMVQTEVANMRLFLQIWDSQQGAIVWEATEELNYAWDTTRERPVTFQIVVEEIARNLISKLPPTDTQPTSNAD